MFCRLLKNYDKNLFLPKSQGGSVGTGKTNSSGAFSGDGVKGNIFGFGGSSFKSPSGVGLSKKGIQSYYLVNQVGIIIFIQLNDQTPCYSPAKKACIEIFV